MIYFVAIDMRIFSLFINSIFLGDNPNGKILNLSLLIVFVDTLEVN